MSTWFECKVRYDKMGENGVVKKETEAFLIDALSFTEAEARIIKERQPYISGEFNINAVKRTKISEIFRDETADKWYLAKVAFIAIDEKTGAEKRSISQMLVAGSDFRGAFDTFYEGMKNTLGDFDLVSLSETLILEVYDAELGNLPDKA